MQSIDHWCIIPYVSIIWYLASLTCDCWCVIDYLGLLTHNHLSIIGYPSVYVCLLCPSHIEHYVSMPICLQHKTEYRIVICRCAILSLHICLLISNLMDSWIHLHRFLVTACVFFVHICVSISPPLEYISLHFVYLDLYVCVSVRKPQDVKSVAWLSSYWSIPTSRMEYISTNSAPWWLLS